MATVNIVPIAAIKPEKKRRGMGPRVQRRQEFDRYVAQLLDNPDDGLLLTDLDEPATKVLPHLRFAFKRAGIAAKLGKVRGQEAVWAHLIDAPDEDEPDESDENVDFDNDFPDEDAAEEDEDDNDVPLPARQSRRKREAVPV